MFYNLEKLRKEKQGNYFEFKNLCEKVEIMEDNIKHILFKLEEIDKREEKERTGESIANKILIAIEDDMDSEYERWITHREDVDKPAILELLERLKKKLPQTEYCSAKIKKQERILKRHEIINREAEAYFMRNHPFYDVYQLLINSTLKSRMTALELFNKKYQEEIRMLRGCNCKFESWENAGWDPEKKYIPTGLYSTLYPLFKDLEKEIIHYF